MGTQEFVSRRWALAHALFSVCQVSHIHFHEATKMTLALGGLTLVQW